MSLLVKFRQEPDRLSPSHKAGGRALGRLFPALLLGAFLAGGAGFALLSPRLRPLTAPAAACGIKGDISIGSGERIYHMPTQKTYATAIISRQAGERWFCSEADARKAGWRKSRD